jgi:hypothetical protein
VRQEIPQEVAKSIPPVAVTAVAVVNNMTLSDWVAVATLGYIALQAGYLLWKWFKEWRGKRR